MFTLKNVIITIVSVAIIGLGVNAFAHRGMGWGGGGHHGSGMYGQDRYGTEYDNQLSKEDYKKFEQKREAFFKETQDIRTNLLEKERELQSELAKVSLMLPKHLGCKRKFPNCSPNLIKSVSIIWSK